MPQIDADAANIPNINMVVQGSAPAAPTSGHVRLYVGGTTLYLLFNTGDPISVGLEGGLPEGQLAIGDSDDLLSAFPLGTEGQLVTADANGHAAWADAPAPGGGDCQLIEQVIVGAGGAASVAFANIAATWAHLRIVGMARTDRASQASDVLSVRFNSDAGSNYDAERYTFSGTATASGAAVSGGTSAPCAGVPAANAPANYPGVFTLDIPNYRRTTFYKAFTASAAFVLSQDTSNTYRQVTTGYWRSTAAITAIALLSLNGANLIEGSLLSLYGLT